MCGKCPYAIDLRASCYAHFQLNLHRQYCRQEIPHAHILQDMEPNRALLDAVKKGDLQWTTELLSALPPDVEDPYIHAALVVAATQGREDLCAVLLGEGADPTYAFEGSSAIAAAVARRHLRILEQLSAVVATLPPQKQLAAAAILHNAVEGGDLETVDLLLQAGYDAAARDATGNTPLHRAAFGGQMGAIQLLLEHGASADVANDEGATPLHYTCLQGRTEAAQMLMALGGQPNAATRGGSTPLHAAATEGHATLVAALLMAGAGVDSMDNDGFTVGGGGLVRKGMADRPHACMIAWISG
jgi:ankyrin repeat protein